MKRRFNTLFFLFLFCVSPLLCLILHLCPFSHPLFSVFYFISHHTFCFHIIPSVFSLQTVIPGFPLIFFSLLSHCPLIHFSQHPQVNLWGWFKAAAAAVFSFGSPTCWHSQRSEVTLGLRSAPPSLPQQKKKSFTLLHQLIILSHGSYSLCT